MEGLVGQGSLGTVEVVASQVVKANPGSTGHSYPFLIAIEQLRLPVDHAAGIRYAPSYIAGFHKGDPNRMPRSRLRMGSASGLTLLAFFSNGRWVSFGEGGCHECGGCCGTRTVG
jgi:hypothetical protein